MSTDTRLRFNKKTLETVPLPQPGSRLTFHDLEVPGLQLRVTDPIDEWDASGWAQALDDSMDDGSEQRRLIFKPVIERAF